MDDERARPGAEAADEEDWAEDEEGEWEEEGEWSEETRASQEAKPGPKQPPAYVSWLAGLVGLVLGLMAFRSCNP